MSGVIQFLGCDRGVGNSSRRWPSGLSHGSVGPLGDALEVNSGATESDQTLFCATSERLCYLRATN
jgi:hypothetical protein